MRWGVFAPTPLWPTPGGHQETGWEEGNLGITAAGVIEIKGSRAPHKVSMSLEVRQTILLGRLTWATEVQNWGVRN